MNSWHYRACVAPHQTLRNKEFPYLRAVLVTARPPWQKRDAWKASPAKLHLKDTGKTVAAWEAVVVALQHAWLRIQQLSTS